MCIYTRYIKHHSRSKYEVDGIFQWCMLFVYKSLWTILNAKMKERDGMVFEGYQKVLVDTNWVEVVT